MSALFMIRDRYLLLLYGICLIMASCTKPDRDYPLVEAPSADENFYQHAISDLERRVKVNPNNPDALYKKALYLQASGETDAALSSVKQAISLNPNPDYLMTEAELLSSKQEYELALARISRAQILGGDYPDLWHLMSQLNYYKGNYEVALQEVANAIRKYPEGIAYYCTKGKIQWAMNDTLGAVNSFSRSMDHPETRYESMTYLAVINKSTGDFDRAFQYLNQNLSTNPSDRDLLLEKGKLYMETVKFDSALQIFHQLRKMDSTDWKPFYQSALVHFNSRRLDSALYYTAKTLELHHNHLPSMLTQARVYDRWRYYGTAIKTYQEILTIDSTYLPAVDDLAKLKGKIAYLQRIQRDREANSQVEIISPTKPPVKNNE